MTRLKRFRTFMCIVLIQVLTVGQLAAMDEAIIEDSMQSYYYEAKELEKLGVFKGTSQGFELYREPTRLEALIMMMRMLGLEEEVLVREDSTSYFLDVPSWGYEYVNIAFEKGLTQGTSESVFGMDQTVDAKMFLTFMLRALNYNDREGDFSYQEAVEFALNINLIDTQLKEELEQASFTRNHVAKIVFNTLNTPLADDERTLSRVLIDEGKLVQEDQTKGPIDTSPEDDATDDATPNDDNNDEEVQGAVEELTPIMGEAIATAKQLEKYLLSKNPNPKINTSVREFAQLWIDEGAREGVRGDIAFAQACHETGYFKYGGIVEPHQNNYGGIGALNGNATGEAATFSSPQEGVRASIQHLKAYASTKDLRNDVVDPRFDLVSRGVAPYVEDLGGKWAWPGFDRSKYATLEEALAAKDSYGHTILKKYEDILDM